MPLSPTRAPDEEAAALYPLSSSIRRFPTPDDLAGWDVLDAQAAVNLDGTHAFFDAYTGRLLLAVTPVTPQPAPVPEPVTTLEQAVTAQWPEATAVRYVDEPPGAVEFVTLDPATDPIAGFVDVDQAAYDAYNGVLYLPIDDAPPADAPVDAPAVPDAPPPDVPAEPAP